MSASNLWGLGILVAFVLSMLGSAVVLRSRPARGLREISAFQRLKRSVGLAVEAGNRLHLSLGRGIFLGTQNAVGFVGLSVLDRIARSTSASDRPPVSTAGESVLAVLSQDTQRKASKEMGAEFDPTRGRLTGLTPFSYASGTLSLIQDEDIGANLLIGSFGNEVALITEAAERSGSMTLAGTDNLSGQAVLYATAEEPLIGEETYAGGAYLGAGNMHIASLYAQDILRWLIVVLIILGAILKLAGVI